MRRLFVLLLMPALSAATSSPPSTPAKAFECSLPYRQAMESLRALTIRETKTQRILWPRAPYGRSENFAEFATANVRIFGQTAARLAVSIKDPDTGTGRFEAQIIAEFPHEPAIDTAIQQANKWHLNACGPLRFCSRANDGQANRALLYYREQARLRLLCTYDLTPSDIDN